MAKLKLKNTENFCPSPDPANDTADRTEYAALKNIINNMPDAFFYQLNLVTDTYDYISPSCRQVFGLSVDEFRKMTGRQVMEQLVHPEDRLRLQEAAVCLIRTNLGSTKNSIEVEHRVKDRNGKYRWMRATLRIIFDEQGGPSAIIGCTRDIEETAKLQKALQLSQQRVKNLYDRARIALFRSTTGGDRLLECNYLFAWTMGFDNVAQCTEEFALAKNIVYSAEYEKIISDVRDSRVVNNREIKFWRKDGSECWMSISAVWLDEESFGGTAVDITATRALNDIEVGILKLMLAGLSNKEIATRLNRSRRTIEDHRAHIMKKLNAQNLVDLANHYSTIVL